MTYDRFREILIEVGITREETIANIWRKRPTDDLSEQRVRECAKHVMPIYEAMYGKWKAH